MNKDTLYVCVRVACEEINKSMQNVVERAQHEPIWLTFSRPEKSLQTKLWHLV